MIIFELTNSEQHPAYQALEIANGNRQYDFLRSMVTAALQMERPFLSSALIKALNFHAIACLHTSAGDYRPCGVKVGNYIPPDHYRVQAQMDDFINMANRTWPTTDPVTLSAYVLWRLNHIHPFINGNGRTARAASYFVLCVSLNGWLPGTTILPELLRQNHPEYVAALQAADVGLQQAGKPELSSLHGLLTRLLAMQLDMTQAPRPPNPTP